MKTCFGFLVSLSMNEKRYSVTKDFDLLKAVFGDKCRSNVFIWFNKFKNDHESVGKDFRSTRLPILITNENIAKIRNLVRSDRWLTITDMVDDLNIKSYAVESILIQHFNMRQVLAKFSSKLLSGEQKNTDFKCPKKCLIGLKMNQIFYLFLKLKLPRKRCDLTPLKISIPDKMKKFLNSFRKEHFWECFENVNTVEIEVYS